jgi:hypothetical protein
MVSKQLREGTDVVAANIVPCSSDAKNLQYVGISLAQANDVRNGLMLAVGFEKAFDQLQISFLKINPLKDALFLHIWDDNCRQIPLWEGCSKTIGDYDGFELDLRNHKPFMRCLSYQAYQAYLAFRSCSSEQPPAYYGSPTDSMFDQAMLADQFFRHVENEMDDEEVHDDRKLAAT